MVESADVAEPKVGNYWRKSSLSPSFAPEKSWAYYSHRCGQLAALAATLYACSVCFEGFISIVCLDLGVLRQAYDGEGGCVVVLCEDSLVEEPWQGLERWWLGDRL